MQWGNWTPINPVLDWLGSRLIATSSSVGQQDSGGNCWSKTKEEKSWKVCSEAAWDKDYITRLQMLDNESEVIWYYGAFNPLKPVRVDTLHFA